MTTNYEKGAAFERRVLKYLTGYQDKKQDKFIVGALHEYLSDMAESAFGVSRASMIQHTRIWGRRTPGSKSPIDLPILITILDREGGIVEQIGLGVQCKTERYQSKGAIRDALKRIQATTGWYPFWAYQAGRGKIAVEPDLRPRLYEIFKERGVTRLKVQGIISL